MWNYLMSVLVFIIIINASVSITKVCLENKGRLEKINKFNKENKGLPSSISILVTSCVPIFRTIVVIIMYYICFCNDEQFNKIFKKI